LIYSKTIFATQHTIPVLEFQPGLYFVKVITSAGSFREKIVIQ
jgi:hypothetical protein